ncbi:hypothetical protein GW17_00030209 [Ensete ventricosum]|nr:hypothetical protein GW17_00030209 [Ensete ventricosum]
MSFASSHSEPQSVKILAHMSRVLSRPFEDFVSVAVVPSSSVPGDSGTVDALVAIQSLFNVDSTVTTRQLVEVRKNYFIHPWYELHVPLSGEHPYDAFSCGFSLFTDALEVGLREFTLSTKSPYLCPSPPSRPNPRVCAQVRPWQKSESQFLSSCSVGSTLETSQFPSSCSVGSALATSRAPARSDQLSRRPELLLSRISPCDITIPELLLGRINSCDIPIPKLLLGRISSRDVLSSCSVGSALATSQFLSSCSVGSTLTTSQFPSSCSVEVTLTPFQVTELLLGRINPRTI